MLVDLEVGVMNDCWVEVKLGVVEGDKVVVVFEN